MKLTIALCLCWAGQILWLLAIMRAAARPMPKPGTAREDARPTKVATARGDARPTGLPTRLTTLNPKLLRA